MNGGVETLVTTEGTRSRDRIPWRGSVLAVVLVATVMLVGIVDAAINGVSRDTLVFVPVATAFLFVGSLLVIRVPENRVSWVMLAIALGFGFLRLAESLSGSGVEDLVNGIGLWALFLPGLGVLVPLWFPTGRPTSPGWRWVGWLALAGVIGIFGGTAYVGLVERGDTDVIESCASVGTCSNIVGLVALLVAVLAAIVSLVVRWRGAGGVERLQLRWLVPSFAVLGAGLLAEFGGFQGSLAGNVLLPAGAILVPVAIGFAILRYRLYEIDRIVSRTVSYAVVVGLLGLVFFGVVTLLTSLLPAESDLAVAGSTLAVAALFNPVRKRVQVWVDRRFNRSRYDAQKVMDGFAGSLRDRVDPDGVVEGWVRAVSETMQPSTVAVWVREATAAWDRR